jgi:hypothetical protein
MEMTDSSHGATHVLWTGGWDSTYRVLDLVLVEQRAVQPIYVADPRRRSTSRELAAISSIRTAVLARCPAAEGLLPQPEVVDRLAIPPDPEVTAAYERMTKIAHLGTQYEWLARLRRHRKLDGIELSIHNDDRAAVFQRDVRSADFDLVLGGYGFPLLGLTKLDMQREAMAKGFADLMEMTWFCHGAGKVPCGRCAPCRFSIKEGMGRRVPMTSRLSWYAFAPARILWRNLKRLRPAQ